MTGVDDVRTFSSAQLLEATGLTFRQLDYWASVDVLWPISPGGPNPGSGVNRRWSEREVQVVGALKALADLRCSTRVLRVVATTLRWMADDDLHGMLFVDSNAGLSREPCHACYCLSLDDVLATVK